MKYLAAAVASFLLAACGGEADTASSPEENTSPPASEVETGNAAETPHASTALNEMGQEFVKLSLAIGVLDPAFVDAYHGPKEWADAVAGQAQSFEALAADAQALLIKVARANADAPSLRGAMLEKLVRASAARIEIVQDQFYPFDEETRLLYDAVAPQYDVDEFYAVLTEIDALLPGDGPLYERVDAFRNSLAIAQDKLLPVFNAAIAECRKRTLAHYKLPDNERFRLEFVTGKPWSGYNWYQGDYESLIQVNTDFPIIIDRAVDLGCHEGYPGHHTWNIMIERDFLKGNGWIEYSVYPLFSPLSVTAEGSANYGIELAFPGDEKITFERDVLFPLAGLNPEDAEKLDQLNKARRKLSHSRNYIARAYLDGDIDRGEAIRLSMEFGLQSRERAEQGVRFIETYRGYVINYNLGRDLVENYVDRKAAAGEDRWDAFRTLLTTPLAASDIEAAQ
jgi:hypothetical protein